MSNEEEKKCPLCTEEMDWTDQQFNPCECGYQVCVWCWHHLIDMAEKDETEGRCPACRTIYEKEKIVAMQANSERVVTKNSNRKSKPPKSKPKTTEVKKDLTNVRVIQRKMAYVIGLPLSLADEDLLQRKEYFGQYGKIVKISLSRTAGGAIQRFINESCSVYVTYSKEEEALRCIQTVHGFVLEGRFLRASFGTAKYCHAWLRNMPCNNPACLYLHSIGAEEDSFGKHEVAAVHTRNRVQQIVGAANNVLQRSGCVLPPPLDEFSDNGTTSIEKSTVRSTLNESTHGGQSAGGFGAPSKMTTFVDIVGQSGSSGPERDEIYAEDRRILNLCSDLLSITVNKNNQIGDTYSSSMLSKAQSPSHLVNRLHSKRDLKEFSDELFREDMMPFDHLLSKDSSNLSHIACFHRSSYPAEVPEDSGGHLLLHKRNHSSSNFSIDQNSVHSPEDEASLPFTCVNSVLNDRSLELKFQSSAKSDMIYRSSNSFSNEEIVEHLRRIDNDNLTNDNENSALDTVESSIISNIMAMDFDSYDDSLPFPHGLAELLDETEDQRGSSWHSYTSGKSAFSFTERDGVPPSLNNFGQASTNSSILKDSGGNSYLPRPHYQASRAPSLAPPGFTVPSSEAPPGFSAYERTGRFPCSSAGCLVNTHSPLNSLLKMPSTGNNSSNSDDLADPAILSCGKGKPTSMLNIPGLDRPVSNPKWSAFEDETRLRLLMQQSTSVDQESKYSEIFGQQNPSVHKEPGFAGGVEHELSSSDNIYGHSSRLMDRCQAYNSSSFSQLPPQKPANGHVPNGYQHSLDEVQWKNEVGMSELQRNEKLGLNRYFPPYGDLVLQMNNSGDVYTRVFGM